MNSPPCSPSELSAAWPWLGLPADTLAAPCPGVPSSASSVLKPDLFLQSPMGSISAQDPPVPAPPALERCV